MKVFTTIVAIFFSFIMLEFLTRVMIDDGLNYEIEMLKYANKLKKISNNPEVGIEHKKNISAKLMGVQVDLDKNGFRYQKDQKVIEKNKKILMIGDSMTFGWGAQSTFSNVLSDSNPNISVFNSAIGNTNTSMQIENFLQNFKDLYNYDVIVLNFFINDLEKIKIKEPTFYEKYSYFYTFFSNTINKTLIKFRLKENWNDFYSKSFEDEMFIRSTLDKILTLNNYCKEQNIKFVIHNIPELRDLDSYKFNKETKLIENFAKKYGIKFINSHIILKQYEEEKLWVTVKDPHANDFAHKIIGQYLSNSLKSILN
jgi:hypothetical protein